MSRSRRQIVVTLVAVGALLAVAVSSALAMRSHATTAQASYTVSGKATGSKGTGTLLREAHHERRQGDARMEADALAGRRGRLGGDPRRRRHGDQARKPLLTRAAPVRTARRPWARSRSPASWPGGRNRRRAEDRRPLHGAIKASKAGSGGTRHDHRSGHGRDDRQGQGNRRQQRLRGLPHASTARTSTGPTWKGLAGSTVASDHRRDDQGDRLVPHRRDHRSVDAEGRRATTPGVMAEVIPPGHISKAQAALIVAYIHSLK